MQASLKAPCPLCREEIDFVYRTENIPYFSDILIISARCSCGFRHSDIMVLSEGEPVQWTLKVGAVEDLNIRVVRGTTGVIEIPEMGISVDPGPACEGAVTNVEGILNSIAEVLENLLETEDGSARERAGELLAEIERVKAGGMEITLVIRDPKGNSGIVSDKAERSHLVADAVPP
ncbi:MAG: ZPR1 zinc finger domain-containing protein [Methanomicrobiales archaeon]|nr:ZPR1 zinc finger domain-containing protein [Methanomicrobiales archaeon]